MFSTPIFFPLVYNVSCFISPGMVLQGLKALDLTEIEKSWSQISVLIESSEISVPCAEVVAKLYSSPAYFYDKF